MDLHAATWEKDEKTGDLYNAKNARKCFEEFLDLNPWKIEDEEKLGPADLGYIWKNYIEKKGISWEAKQPQSSDLDSGYAALSGDGTELDLKSVKYTEKIKTHDDAKSAYGLFLKERDSFDNFFTGQKNRPWEMAWWFDDWIDTVVTDFGVDAEKGGSGEIGENNRRADELGVGSGQDIANVASRD
jgi:hypothetical protein